MTKKRIAATACAAAAVLLLAACGNKSGADGLPRVELDTGTDSRVSTLTIGDDSYTLPCIMREFVGNGYGKWVIDGYEMDFSDTSIMYKYGKFREGYYTVLTDEGCLLSVCVAYTSDEEMPQIDCMIYRAEIQTGSGGYGWEYMGLTPESTPEEVLQAFDGILEFEERKGDGNYRLTHDDLERSISFYWEDDGGEMVIRQLVVEIIPDGTWKEYDSNFYYTIPEEG